METGIAASLFHIQETCAAIEDGRAPVLDISLMRGREKVMP